MVAVNEGMTFLGVNVGTNPTVTGGAAAPWARPSAAPTSVSDGNFPGDLTSLTSCNAECFIYLMTSYADTAGTTIANQVENIYNGLGQLAFQNPGAAIYSMHRWQRGYPHPHGRFGMAEDNVTYRRFFFVDFTSAPKMATPGGTSCRRSN